MSRITTHVLDTVLGEPAAGIAILLEREGTGGWSNIARGETDKDGRCATLAAECTAGVYRLTFETNEYFLRQGRISIYPKISIILHCGADPHYHLPLLLSENSYTTYRGS